MTEKARELLSVLMDGEASEIEIHRLLRQMGEDESLINAWVTYQETRRVLRSPSSNRTGTALRLSSQVHLELHRRISLAIDEDSTIAEGSAAPLTKPAALFSRPAALSSRSAALFSRPAALFSRPAALFSRPAALFSRPAAALSSRPAAALALAASVVAAVFIGIQLNNPQDISTAGFQHDVVPEAENTVARQTRLVAAAPVAVERGNELKANDLELKELDEEGRRRLRTLLNQHERMIRIKPNTLTVTYPSQPNK